MRNNVKINWEAEHASGNRKSWAKTVTGLTSGGGSKGLVGEYLREGEQLIPDGTIVIEVYATGSVKHGSQEVEIYRVTHDGLYETNGKRYDWKKQQVSFREYVAELLAEPLQSPSESSSEVPQIAPDTSELTRKDRPLREFLSVCSTLSQRLTSVLEKIKANFDYAEHAEVELGSLRHEAVLLVEGIDAFRDSRQVADFDTYRLYKQATGKTMREDGV